MESPMEVDAVPAAAAAVAAVVVVLAAPLTAAPDPPSWKPSKAEPPGTNLSMSAMTRGLSPCQAATRGATLSP